MAETSIQPMRMRTISRASYSSVQLTSYFEEQNGEFKKLGTGTAFLYEFSGRKLLITNWHVVTGRHPEKPSQTLPKYPSSPTHIELSLANQQNPNRFLPTKKFALYDDNRAPVWFETKLGYGMIDLVAIQFPVPPSAIWPTVQDHAPRAMTAFEPGTDVSIIGFPFPQTDGLPFPIWKRGMIASEPSIVMKGKPMMMLDTPGRPGMSGSPVYFTHSAAAVHPTTAAALNDPNVSDLDKLDLLDPESLLDRTTRLEFAGVYSGSYGDADFEQLQLGRFWGASLVDSLVTDPRRGTNPFPPIFGADH